jgi:hypothetical protein
MPHLVQVPNFVEIFVISHNLITMKQLLTFLCAMFFAITAQAQWTADVTANTLVSERPGVVISNMASTPSGNTYVTFYTGAPGNYQIWVQLIDNAGNRKFGPDGIQLVSLTASWLSFDFAATDSEENLYLAYSDNSSGTAVLQKVDPTGAILFGENGINAGEAPVSALSVTPDDHILIATLESTGGKITRYDADGNLEWSVTSENESWVKKLQPLSDGSFYAVLLQGIPGTFYYYFYVMNYNADGTPGWKSPKPLCASYSNLPIRDVELVIDQQNSLYSAITFPTSFSESYVFVQKTDIAGNILWGPDGVKTLEMPAIFCQKYRISYIPDLQQLFLVINYLNGPQDQAEIGLQKIDIDGNLMFTNNGIKAVNMSAALPTLAGAEMCSDFSTVFCFAESGGTINAVKADLDGNLLWQAAINDNIFPNNPRDVLMTKGSDDQMIFSFFENRTVLEFYEQIFIQNIHCDGSFTSTRNLIDKDRAIAVFPNPVNANNLQIEFVANYASTQVVIEVFTPAGICAQKIRVDIQEGFNTFQIPVDKLSSGMYFIRINGQGSARFVKILD